MKGGRKGGSIGSMLTGLIMTLVMIGVVLAGLQLTGVSSVEDTIKLVRDKAIEYSECIPAGDCGLVSVIDGIDTDNKMDLESIIHGNGDNKKSGGNKETAVELPDVKGIDLDFSDFSIGRDVKGYRGPEKGEPYVTQAGLVSKEIAAQMLAKLEIVSDKDDKNKDVGYSRKEWKHWSTYKPCWNVRNEVLNRDAVPGTVKFVDKQKNATENYDEACAIGVPVEDNGIIKIDTSEAGEWIDPYSGKKMTDSSTIDIDHIVPLSNAARNGGQDWTLEQKEQFANDLDNLLATSAKENRAKGDKGPGEYMPPNKSYHCQYAKSYTSIAYKYELTITESDYKVLSEAIQACKH